MESTTHRYRLATAVAVVTFLFLGYAIGALGIIGAGGPVDLMYVGAVVVGLVGAVLARFRARGMALALGATSVVTLLVGVVAVAAGLHHREGASVVEIMGLSAMFAVLWAVSAWLYDRAAHSPAR